MNDQDQSKTCPKCEATRPSGDTECACGYKFETGPVKKRYTLHETIAIARAQKVFLWFILIGIVSVCALPFVRALTLPVLILGALFFLYRLLSTLKVKSPVLWVVGMFFLWVGGASFFPLVGIILILIFLYVPIRFLRRATAAIRAKGFRVGLMGAKISEMEARAAEEASQDSVRV